MVKSPASFGVPLQADSRPAFDAPRVLPMDNAQARAAEQLGGATVDAGLGTLRYAQAAQEREAHAMEELKRRTDRARAQEADSKIADGYREILSGKEGYRTMLGRQAVDNRGMTIEAVERHRARILDLLSPAQREMVAASEATRYQHARETIDAHYAQQVRIDEQASSEARAEGGMRDAVDGYFTPTVRLDGGDSRSLFEDNRQAVHTELLSLAASRGLSKDSADALLRQADENMYGGVMRRLVEEGSAREAQSFYEVNKDKFSEQARARFSDGLTTAVAKEDASNLAQELTSMQPTLMGRLDELQKRGVSGLVFNETLKALTQNDQQLAEARNQAQNRAWDRIERYAQLHGGNLDAEHQQLVKDAQLEDKFALASSRGMLRVTTDVGSYALHSTTAADLRARYPSEEALVNAMVMHVTPAQLGDLVLRWKNGATEAPKKDKSLFLVDAYRTAHGKPQTFEVPKDSMQRWTEAVNNEIRTLLAKKENAARPEESLWPEAVKAAQENGYFTSSSLEPSTFRLYAEADPNKELGDIFVKLPDGRALQANLDDIVPGTSMRWRDQVKQEFESQALVEEPGKPKGYVRFKGGIIPYSDLTPSMIVEQALAANMQANKTRRENLRSEGLRWLQSAKEHEERAQLKLWSTPVWTPEEQAAAQSSKTGSIRRNPSPGELRYMEEQARKAGLPAPQNGPWPLDQLSARASAAVRARWSEWRGFGLTEAEVSSVLGAEPPRRLPDVKK